VCPVGLNPVKSRHILVLLTNAWRNLGVFFNVRPYLFKNIWYYSVIPDIIKSP
jgi:hypothetical protein